MGDGVSSLIRIVIRVSIVIAVIIPVHIPFVGEYLSRALVAVESEALPHPDIELWAGSAHLPIVPETDYGLQLHFLLFNHWLFPKQEVDGGATCRPEVLY